MEKITIKEEQEYCELAHEISYNMKYMASTMRFLLQCDDINSDILNKFLQQAFNLFFYQSQMVEGIKRRQPITFFDSHIQVGNHLYLNYKQIVQKYEKLEYYILNIME